VSVQQAPKLPDGVPWVISAAKLTPGAQCRSAGRTLTEADLTMACMWSGDWHTLHADRHAMQATKLGERIFAGTFGIVLAVAQAGHALQFVEPVVAASGINSWHYHSAVRLGATLHTVVTVQALEPHASKPWLHVLRHLALTDSEGVTVQSGIAGVWVEIVSAGAAA
jgi:acyl dehydratase